MDGEREGGREGEARMMNQSNRTVACGGGEAASFGVYRRAHAVCVGYRSTHDATPSHRMATQWA